jgi:N utilization substance protein B
METAKVKVSRRANRAVAMQLLYLHDVDPLVGIDGHWLGLREMENLADGEEYAFARELAAETIANLREINEWIGRFLANWSLQRVERVVLAILRLATCELLRRPTMPTAVIINEAVELGKRYASPESTRLLNGLLDTLRGHIRPAG